MTAEQGAEVAAALRDGARSVPPRDDAGAAPTAASAWWRGAPPRCATPTATIRSAVSVGLDLTEQRAAEDRARRAHAALDVRSHELERSNRDLARFAELAANDLRAVRRGDRGLHRPARGARRPAARRARAQLPRRHARGGRGDARAARRRRRLRPPRPRRGARRRRRLRPHARRGAVRARRRDRGDAAPRSRATRCPSCPAIPTSSPPCWRTSSRTPCATARPPARRRASTSAPSAARLGWQLTVSDQGAGVPRGRAPAHLPDLPPPAPRGAHGAASGSRCASASSSATAARSGSTTPTAAAARST